MEAAQEGHIELVKFLLENGANGHAQTQTRDTALTYACENGHTDVAEVLLIYGAELEHESEGGRTPLMKSCRAGHICTIKFLISKGADVNRQSTNNDHTPLSLACAGGHQAVVELLLKSGADPFHKLKDNSTMLIEASKGGHIGVVQLLLDYPESMLNSPMVSIMPDVNGQIRIHHENQALQVVVPQSQALKQAQPQIQQVQQQIQQQQIQQQQQQIQLNAPPGLHEVPEAIRVSNQQLFHNQGFNNHKEFIEHQIISNPIVLPKNLDNKARMRYFRNQGYKDGLAQGFRAPVGNVMGNVMANNQSNVNQSPLQQHQLLQQQQQQLVMPSLVPSPQSTNNSNQNNQKSLLRKNRQAPAPFELSSIDGQAVRSQPVGEDKGATCMNNSDDILVGYLQLKV